ncbi:hypothetical protein HG536_0B02630 [Torulaspora globosa]|uniref:XPG N-terminal domain-containing protein n=1 Tax=Torulaspora globosa TaxID=48254 RepID=A0A7G3ZD14_9SACH|nr:uncharacterized protein HG536_0B02630 [Torulaspora globosa]QLL31400.1 hypothetical protein HG536_0B02630 [Torulaspora globosa]
MAIKSLESYLFERGLVGSYPIEALKNAALGVDVNHYVSRLLTSKREQYLDAIGGFPTSLKMYLESDLKIFKEYNITPVFVFNGSMVSNQLENSDYLNGYAAEAAAVAMSSPGSKASTSSSTAMYSANSAVSANKEAIFIQRHRGWTQWNNLRSSNQTSYIDQPIQPQEPFRYNTMIESKRFYSDLIAYFIDNDIIYQVAPYTSWSQLSYLMNSGYIDAIYGPTDCLMLSDVDKFILGMEFPNKEFRFIDKTRILREFNCSHEEFVDIAMAVGNDLQPVTLPPLQIYPASQVFEIALEMVVTTGTNFYAYQFSNPIKTESVEFVDKYQKGVSALRYMPVLKDSGKVELYVEAENIRDYLETDQGDGESHATSDKGMASKPSKAASLTRKPVPSDVHAFIAQQLPSEYYFYKSLGLVSGKLFDAITTGVYPEEPPLVGGSTNSYRNLVKKSVDLFKNKEINLLTQPINRYYQIKPIKQVNWFAPEDATVLVNRVMPSIFDKLNRLIVKTDDIERQFSMKSFITLINNSDDLGNDFISDNVIFPNSVPAEKKLLAPFDLLSTSFLRFLYQLDFFDLDLEKKILKPTEWGSVFLKLNEMSVDPKFHESILILLVFLKLDVLSLSQDTVPSAQSALSQATLRSYPQESLYVLLLTRLLTLYQIEQKPSNYHGPVDKKTLIFRDHLHYVKANMNEMYEAVIVSSLTSGEFDRVSLEGEAWQKKIVRNMPFKLTTPNTVMAMMWQFFLQKYLHNGNAKADALTLIATEFSTYKSTPNLEQQFSSSHEFLQHCSRVLTALASHNLIKNDDALLFEKAVKFSGEAFAS